MIDQYLLEKKSIKQALSGDWRGAVITNTDILKEYPDDIGALNRLAKAQMEIDLIDEAKTNLKRILVLDIYNSVAKTNLEKLTLATRSKRTTVSPLKPATTTSYNFIEEPGKTKIVQLVRLGDPVVTGLLRVGEEVFMKLAKKIKILNGQRQFIGYLPDDLSLTLYHYSEMGNKYQILVKSANKKAVEVFIRETKQAKKLKGMPSFTDYKNNYIPQVSLRSLSEAPLEIFDDLFSDEEESGL